MLKIKAEDRRTVSERYLLFETLANMGVPVSMSLRTLPNVRSVNIIGTRICFVFKGDKLIRVED